MCINGIVCYKELTNLPEALSSSLDTHTAVRGCISVLLSLYLQALSSHVQTILKAILNTKNDHFKVYKEVGINLQFRSEKELKV